MNNLDPTKLRTLDDLVRWRAAQQPEQRAFTFLADGETVEVALTYGELDRRARGLGALLQSHKAAGERVLLLYPPGLEYISAFLGCFYAGTIAVPSYPPRLNRPSLRLQAIATDAQATLVLTTADIFSNAERYFVHTPELAALHWLTTDNLANDHAEEWRDPGTARGELAFLQYTSGSTATPKGVMVSHANLMCNLETIHHSFETRPEARGVFWLPFYHDMGLIGGILETLYCGGESTLLSPVDFIQRPIRWLQAISRTRATISGGPNFAYDLCVQKITPEQREALDLNSWGLAFNGAEPVRLETMDQFVEVFEACGFRREAFYPCYGLAESTLIVSGGAKAEPPVACTFQRAALAANQVVTAADHDVEGQTLVSSGQTLPGQQIVIVDPESSVPCPPGRVGEIWVSSGSVAQGYWNRPEETANTFGARLADSGAGPFLRTGDLGFLREGELFVTGRLKDLIIIRGHNHYPQDIEQTVAQSHPALEPGGGAAFSVEAGGEERLVIVQELKRTQRDADVDEVVQAVRKAVAEEHALQVYAIALLRPMSIPKTSSGKVQRSLCRKQFLEQSLKAAGLWTQDLESGEAARAPRPKLTTAYVPPRNETEQKLAEIWQEALKLEQVGVDDNFFELGGDSLLAAQIFTQVRETFRLELQMTGLVQHATVAATANYIEAVRWLASEQPAVVQEGKREKIRL